MLSFKPDLFGGSIRVAQLSKTTMNSFNPTHHLVSHARRIPVRVISKAGRSQIFTEAEWGKTSDPAFEVHPKLGVFCRGIQVVGHQLEPIALAARQQAPEIVR